MPDSGKEIQVFISYARDDDAVPPEVPESKGFVSYLRAQLTYEFKKLGQPRPIIWRDKNRITKGDQFDPIIAQAIRDSSILLVVLSRTWLVRPWCQKELHDFAERWKHEGEARLRTRIVVVGKRHVDADKRPSLLQDQQGFAFYSEDDLNEYELEQEFFSRGRIRDPRYEERVEELAGHIWRSAERMLRRGGALDLPEKEPAPAKFAPKVFVPSAATTRGRTIFVAKPADDMTDAYDRVVRELEGRGYSVVPPPGATMPHNASARAFVDEALAAAESSVHLLGVRAGFTPDGEGMDRIVRFQLARAATIATRANGTGPSFRRLIWAPSVFDQAPADLPPTMPRERDPQAVLRSFDRELEGDKIDGQNLSAFIDFLKDHLGRKEMADKELPRLELMPDMRLYLNHSREDEEYVLSLSERLQELRIETILPLFDGLPHEVENFHRDALADCDAVALCWASSNEFWARSHAKELRDWHSLGRSKKFACRTLILAAPRAERKRQSRMLFPRNEIDRIVDLIGAESLSAETLRDLAPEVSDRG